MPMARLIAPTSARPGVRSTFTAASAVMPPGWRARRTPRTGGRTEATGSALAASQAGISPAIDGDRDRDRHGQRRPPR